MWQQHERLLRSTRGQPARCRSNGRQICNETHRWTLPTRSSGDRTRASFSRLPSTWHWWVPRNETAAARRRSFCLFTPRTTTVECEPIRSPFLSVIMFSVTVGVIPVAVWVVDVIRKKLSPSLCLSFLENDHHSKKEFVLAEVVRLVVSSSRQITIQHALFATFSSINNTNNPSVFWKLEKNSPHFVVVLLWTWVFFTFWIRSIRYQMLMKTSDSSTARQRHVSMSVFVTWRQLSDFAQEGVKVPQPWLRPCCANNDGKARPQVWLCD